MNFLNTFHTFFALFGAVFTAEKLQSKTVVFLDNGKPQRRGRVFSEKYFFVALLRFCEALSVMKSGFDFGKRLLRRNRHKENLPQRQKRKEAEEHDKLCSSAVLLPVLK